MIPFEVLMQTVLQLHLLGLLMLQIGANLLQVVLGCGNHHHPIWSATAKLQGLVNKQGTASLEKYYNDDNFI